MSVLNICFVNIHIYIVVSFYYWRKLYTYVSISPISVLYLVPWTYYMSGYGGSEETAEHNPQMGMSNQSTPHPYDIPGFGVETSSEGWSWLMIDACQTYTFHINEFVKLKNNALAQVLRWFVLSIVIVMQK